MRSRVPRNLIRVGMLHIICIKKLQNFKILSCFANDSWDFRQRNENVQFYNLSNAYLFLLSFLSHYKSSPNSEYFKYTTLECVCVFRLSPTPGKHHEFFGWLTVRVRRVKREQSTSIYIIADFTEYKKRGWVSKQRSALRFRSIHIYTIQYTVDMSYLHLYFWHGWLLLLIKVF